MHDPAESLRLGGRSLLKAAKAAYASRITAVAGRMRSDRGENDMSVRHLLPCHGSYANKAIGGIVSYYTVELAYKHKPLSVASLA